MSDSRAYISVSPYLAVLLYDVVTMWWPGRSLGRKLLGIQVVVDGASRTLWAVRAIIRWALPLALAAPLADAFIREIPELVNQEHTPALSGRAWWLWVAVGWWLLVHASTLWDSQRRGWHDKAAGTIVINAPRQPPAQGQYLLAKWQRKWQRRLDRLSE